MGDRVIELPEHLDCLGRDTHFLVRLAQGRVQQRAVTGIAPAAGEADFALVVADAVGADLEDDVVDALELADEQHDASSAPVLERLLDGPAGGEGAANLVAHADTP